MTDLTKDQLSQLEILKQGIDKKYGKNSIRLLGGDEVTDMPRFSSGSAGIDDAIGGGWPWGRIIEIYGPESSGKTTVTLEAIAQAQKLGKICAFIDVEHALDVVYARNLKVDIDNLLISQPTTAEEALDIVEILTMSGIVDVIVLDSVAALLPKKELEGEMGDSHMGLQSRLMSQAMRKITGLSHKKNVTLFFINQIRHKIGVMFGSPETTSGGNALKFYASIRCDIRRTKQINDGDDAIANETKLKCIKNKTAPPYRTAEFVIKFGEGIDKPLDLLRVAVKKGIVDKSGSWYSYNGQKLGQGETNSAAAIAEDEETTAEILKLLKPVTLEDAANDVSTGDDDLRPA